MGDPGMDGAPAVTIPSAGSLRGRAASATGLGLVLALAAGLWQGVNMSAPTNDDFLHLALAQLVLAGEWPVRDFFDNGLVLQFMLSAASQLLVGQRLFSEALVVGCAWAVSTFFVFRLVRQLSGSTPAAALAALLLIASGPRGYSYPKVIVYAVAASLWWAYVWRPTVPRIVALGAWTAVAFYWRPDHGVYVAAGVVLAAIAAHGLGRRGIERCGLAGAVAVAAAVPFFVLVQATVGLREYVDTGLAQANFQHEGGHSWPAWPLRRPADLIRLDPAEEYAPRVTLRWSADSSPAARRAVLERYDLAPEAFDEPLTQRVRLSQRGIGALPAILREPIVEDTAGIERGSATLPWASWTPWDRWRFDHAWLRVRVLPGLDEHTRASEAAAMLFYLLPAAALLLALALPRYLAAPLPAASIVAFAIFAMVVTAGLLRTPYDVRGVDGIAVASILFGLTVAILGRAAAGARGVRRGAIAAATVVFVLVAVKSVAVAGEVPSRAGWLAGEWTSAERMRGAWREVYGRLMASPPLRFHDGRETGVALQLAKYAEECLKPSDRLLVLWFAPEIHYYAGRLAAQRHLVFVPGFARLEHEQRMTLGKVERLAPPLAFAGTSLDGLDTYPGIVEYVRREYDVAGSIGDGEEQHLVFARRDLPVVRTYGERKWPCYT